MKGVQSDKTKPGWCRGSYHHAAALNKAVSHIQTRFAVFLDPDFYIVRHGWINHVIAHMLNNDLSFFGVPWHPRHFNKYRYFPCVHCLFVDLSKISRESLDFTPEVWETTVFYRWKGRILGVMGMGRRVEIGGGSRDTGHRIYRQYGRKSHFRHECVVSVFRPDGCDGRGQDGIFRRIFWHVLPDSLCFVPKRSGYYTQTGFLELGYPDALRMGWEEFLWQAKPFGFHIRRNKQGERDLEQEQHSLAHMIDRFIKIGSF